MEWNRPEIQLPDYLKKQKEQKPSMQRLPPSSPWAVCLPPPEETWSERYLYQLQVDKNRKWIIRLIDTSTASRKNHSSGSKGALNMNGQIYSGIEFAKLRGVLIE